MNDECHERERERETGTHQLIFNVDLLERMNFAKIYVTK